jgi:predicted RNA binding protein YcfA (HicA-like mRNA interferase family)
MVKLYEQAGWRYRHQKGSHYVMKHPSGIHQSIPMHKELKTGMEHDLLKVLREIR